MDLKTLSFNSSGFNEEKANFISFLLNSLGIQIFFLQEHFLLKSNLYKLISKFPNFESFCLPAIRTEKNEYRGRPSGGLSIFWAKTLSNYVKIVKHPESNRVQGIELYKKYVFINVYFPTDPKTDNFDDFELLKCLEDINWYFVNMPNHNFLLGGDFNLDFSRNSRFVNTIRDFFINKNLFTVWSQFDIDFTFGQHFHRNGRDYFATSCIDHFILQNNMLNDVSHAQALHLGDNLSGHEPIFLSIKIEQQNNNFCLDHDLGKKESKPLWSKASTDNIENYRTELKSRLDDVSFTEGLKCNDLNCINPQHHDDIENFYILLTDLIDSSVKNNIPMSDPSKIAKNNVVPGWNDQVRPFREDAKFWNAIWVSLGRPLNCEVYRVMKHTKNVFHYVVRKVKKNKEKIEQEKMLECFLEGNITNLIKKLKNLRSAGNESFPNLMDGKGGRVNIANHFAQKYEQLYNINNTSAETHQFVNDLNINCDDFSEIDLVTPDIVYQAILSVNLNKSDVNFSFKSNAIRSAVDVIYKQITILLQSFLIHGYVPKDLIFCSLKPIVKDKMGDKFSSDNYRAIGSSSIFMKILDWVIFILHETKLKPSELQFGFQKKNSTTMCSWTVVETINFFNNRNTPVFTCFLDLSKAFDLVEFAKLFRKLKNKLGKTFIRVLAFVYVFQMCCVDWAGVKSDPFRVSNGIRQGAVLSPILFSLYIDDLFKLLSNSGFGCYVNNLFYGIIGYADDLVLLSPDLKGLQIMFDITKKFLVDLGLKISVNHDNPEKSKTKCMAFGTKRSPIIFIKLNEFEIPWTDSYKHLGHILYKDGSLKHDVERKRNVFIGSFFELKQELKNQNPLVFMNLIMVYLSHFYGSNLWNLFDIDNIYIAWNKVIRIVFNLPYQTHRYLLEPFSGFKHLFSLLTNRFLKFYETLYYSDKAIIQNLRFFQENDCRSTFTINIRNICRRNNVDNIFDCEKNGVKYFPIDENEIWRVNFLKDLLDSNDFLTENELKDIINHVACN